MEPELRQPRPKMELVCTLDLTVPQASIFSSSVTYFPQPYKDGAVKLAGEICPPRDPGFCPVPRAH